MCEKATAIVLNWARPGNIPQIVDSLLEQQFVSEVIVWDNSRMLDRRPYDGKPVTVLQPDVRNVKCYGRFLAAKQAKTDWVITQDDDYIVRNWPDLWEHALRYPTVITGAMHTGERHGGLIPKLGVSWDLMLGWGSAFLKSHVGLLDKYTERYGTDDIFEEQADRVFACLFGQRHQVLRADCVPLDGHDGPMSMHKIPDHRSIVEIARMRAAEIVRDELLGIHS